MNRFVQWPNFARSGGRSTAVSGSRSLSHDAASEFSPVARHAWSALFIACTLVTAHLWAVAFKPSWADGLIYLAIAGAVFLCGWVFYLHGCAADGLSPVRWYVFAASLAIGGLGYLHGAAIVLFGPHMPSLGHILQGLAGTLTILALTLPLASRNAAERTADISVALCLCGFRIVFLHTNEVVNEAAASAFSRFAFESGLVLIIALVALAASSSAESSFFKSAVLLRFATFVGGICTNQIGVLWYHEEVASPWSITSTLFRVGVALYLLQGITAPLPLHVSDSQKAVLRSLVPFSMSCLLVWLSVLLLPLHPHLGHLGIVIGIGGFLVRSACVALERPCAEERLAVLPLDASAAPSPSTPTLDPLNSIENRAGFQRALSTAARSVSRNNPLSLILFGIENTAEPIDTPSPARDDDQLIAIGRFLSQWSVSNSSLCYMGNARFALLLPATSYPVATSLAEHISYSLENLHLSGPEGPVTVSTGIAEASQPAQVSELLGIATNSLVRSLIREDGRRRPWTATGGLAADC